MRLLSAWLTCEILFEFCGALSQRTIYTLFTTKKTWNEAKAICGSQRGQLVKIKEQRQIEELLYLDGFVWNDQIQNALSSNGIWSGLHLPFANDSWTYQDCESISSTVSVSLSSSTSTCAQIVTSFSMESASCEQKKKFVCQRNEGDCWYEPFFEEEPDKFPSSAKPLENMTDPSECALECRNVSTSNTGSECWGFNYYPAEKICILHESKTADASSMYLHASKRRQGVPDSTFYIRRCFEGSLDSKTYSGFSDTNTEPDTICSTMPYVPEETAMDVCYCSTKEHPPIPAPTSSEEKAKQYEKELTIDSSNTTSALRKLTSAEDNRPSAVGVGFLGVGLLTAVFGGLFLLDLNVLFAGIKSLLCSTESAGASSETDC